MYLSLVGGFNPFEKYSSKWESSPIFGVKIKNICNNHLLYIHILSKLASLHLPIGLFKFLRCKKVLLHNSTKVWDNFHPSAILPNSGGRGREELELENEKRWWGMEVPKVIANNASWSLSKLASLHLPIGLFKFLRCKKVLLHNSTKVWDNFHPSAILPNCTMWKGGLCPIKTTKLVQGSI